MPPAFPRLYLVADPQGSPRIPIEQAVQIALGAGVRLVQYRDKHRPARQIYRTACALRISTAAAGALFIIDDRVDLALAVEADGVHLGQEDLPIDIARSLLGRHRIIGISTHNAREAREAQAGGADYVAYGPVYATSSKAIVAPTGPESIREIAATVSMPIFGIGGIRPQTTTDVIRCGAHGVAVISGILGAETIAGAVGSFLAALVRPGDLP